MSNIFFDSMNTRFKNPIGAVDNKTDIVFLIHVDFDVKHAEFQYNKIDSTQISSIPLSYVGNEGNERIYKVTFKPETIGIYFYRFRLIDFNGRVFYLNRKACQKAVLETEPKLMWQQTVFDSSYTTPDNFRGSIMYQIFPDRFYKSSQAKMDIPKDRIIRCDWGGLPLYGISQDNHENFIGNDYFGGDLKGIEEKLDFFKSLNVSIIYLNPIFESHSNHRYNTADYFKVDPSLGSEKDFIDLCSKAHDLGIRIILDGVFSHVGDDSIYFNKKGRYDSLGAYQSIDSEYRDWFTFDNSPVGYKAWWGVSSLPETCENSPSFTEFICGEKGVLAHWLSLGADGFRLDVADELPDEFLDKIRSRIKAENKDALLIGEVWEDATTKHSHGYRRRYLLGNQLDGVMNYPFKNSILDFILNKNAENFAENILCVLNNYPSHSLECSMNFISTHDTVRALNVLSGSSVCYLDRNTQAITSLSDNELALGISRIKIAFCLLFTLNGIPSIYYGDEAALAGWADPFNRMCYPWGNEDENLVYFVKKLSEIRKNENIIFANGKFKFIFASGGIVAYKRFFNNKQIVTVVNMSDNAISVKDFCNKTLLSTQKIDDGLLPSNSAMIGLIE